MPGKNKAGKPVIYGGKKPQRTLEQQLPVFRSFISQRDKEERLKKRKTK